MNRERLGAALERRIALMAAARRLRLAAALEELEHFSGGRPLRILDGGCGDGLLTLALARRHPSWELVGVDLRESLLAAARERAERLAIRNARFLTADLTAPLPENDFDAVLALECLSEIPDDRMALAQLASVLTDGGLMVVHVPHRDWRPVLKGSSSTWREEVRHGYDSAEISDALSAVGLEAVQVTRTLRAGVMLAQEVRDRLKSRPVRVRAAVFPAIGAAVWLERKGLTWGEPRALLAVGHRPGAAGTSRARASAVLAINAPMSTREMALRRVVLELSVPAEALRPLGWLLPPRRRDVWRDFIRRLTAWQEVRRAVERPVWRELTAAVPVLLYHAFSEREESERYVVSRRRFARQMRLLRMLGYRVVDLQELGSALREHRLPARTVALTIDDGYVDNLRVAVPILRRHRHPATIFLVTERIGRDSDWARVASLRNRPLLSQEQIASAGEEPISFGAHTRTHPNLAGIGPEHVETEIAGSKHDLELVLGRPVATFSYPYGSYDERAMSAVERSGFTAAVTTEPRPVRSWDGSMLIPRIEIFGTDSLPQFLLKLWLGGS